jgi:glutathione peroxidase
MKLALTLCVLAIAGAAWAAFADDAAKVSPPAAPAATDKPAALNFSVKDIDGKDVDLSSYKGKVLLVLNVASYCGNTHQYDGLERLYTRYKDKGLVIMGFPANNFGAQEPGSNAEIKEFCTSQHHVDFPMFAKVSVKGNDTAPLFKYLIAQDSQPVSKGDIAWNFEKFLINREGKLVNRFANKTEPEDATIVKAIEDNLKQ